MPDEIKFAFVLKENLNRNFFRVPQAIVEVSVDNAEDPLTHQRMRDAVHKDFLSNQKKVNDLIRQRDLQISRLGVNERKRQAAILVRTGNESIQRLLDAFKESADVTLTEYGRVNAAKEAKVQAALETEDWRNVRWGIAVLWTGGKALYGLGAIVATGGAATPLMVKEIVDNLMDLQKLFEDLRDNRASLSTARERVKHSLAALKTKPRLTNSDVEAFANELKLYEAKLLAIEMKARAISTRLNAAMAAMPKAGVKPEAIKAAEDALHASLEELIECSKSIKPAEVYLTNLKKKLGAARALAKSDPTLTAVKNWAVATYTKINDFKDILLDPGQLITWIDVAVKALGHTRNLLES